MLMMVRNCEGDDDDGDDDDGDADDGANEL